MWEHRILDATTHTSMVLEQNRIETVFIEVYMITTLSKFNSITFNGSILKYINDFILDQLTYT